MFDRRIFFISIFYFFIFSNFAIVATDNLKDEFYKKFLSLHKEAWPGFMNLGYSDNISVKNDFFDAIIKDILKDSRSKQSFFELIEKSADFISFKEKDKNFKLDQRQLFTILEKGQLGILNSPYRDFLVQFFGSEDFWRNIVASYFVKNEQESQDDRIKAFGKALNSLYQSLCDRVSFELISGENPKDFELAKKQLEMLNNIKKIHRENPALSEHIKKVLNYASLEDLQALITQYTQDKIHSPEKQKENIIQSLRAILLSLDKQDPHTQKEFSLFASELQQYLNKNNIVDNFQDVSRLPSNNLSSAIQSEEKAVSVKPVVTVDPQMTEEIALIKKQLNEVMKNQDTLKKSLSDINADYSYFKICSIKLLAGICVVPGVYLLVRWIMKKRAEVADDGNE